jgi:hypothetical protein
VKDDTQALAQKLGITPSQLQRLRHRYTRKHGEKAEERLCATLRAHWEESRDRTWLLAAQSSSYVIDKDGIHFGYTETPSRAMSGEPEAVPPSEISSYRKSREARDAYQAEQLSDVGELLGACRELRAAIDAMPAKRKQSMSRTLWTLKGRLDECEREIRRRVAA